METPFDRLELLLGPSALNKLQSSRVLLCGVGGVGSWAGETLIRSGIGHLTMLDPDTVKPSNLNRQLCALHSTVGRLKVEVLSERFRDINPSANVLPLSQRLTPENCPQVLTMSRWDCVIDAIDDLPAKISLLKFCVQNQIPVISSMGAANKFDAAFIHEADISHSQGCPLARRLRQALRKEGITSGIRVIFSDEPNDRLPPSPHSAPPGEKRPLGSLMHITAIFGIRCAQAALKILTTHPAPQT